MIVNKVSLDRLNKITTDRTGLGKTGEVYLINRYGYMITHSRFIKNNFLKLKIDSPGAKKCIEDIKKFDTTPHEHSPSIYRDYRGDRVLGIYAHIFRTQWCLLAEIDESEAFAPLHRLSFVLVALMILAPILIWQIGRFAAKLIAGPIYQLRKGIEIIGQGNLDYKVGTEGKDEIGDLSRAFDRMTHDLKKSTTSIGSLQREVVERKKAEEIAQRGEEEWISTFDSITDLIFILDNKYTIIKANKAFIDAIKLKVDDIIGKKCYKLLHEADRPWPNCPFEKTLADKKPHMEEINDTQIGIPLLITTSPISDNKGNLLGCVHIAKDITQLKQAEKKLKESVQIKSD